MMAYGGTDNGRAVRFAAGLGIRRYLDLGTGIPAAGSTHEIVRSVAADSRVVHVDNDPIVLAHDLLLRGGWDLVEPGVVAASEWRPDGDPEDAAVTPAQVRVLSGAAIKP